MLEVNAEAVKTAMMQTAINTKTLSETANISRATAQKLTSKGGKCRIDVIGRVANALNVNANALLIKPRAT